MTLEITDQIRSDTCALFTLDGRLNAVSALELKAMIKEFVKNGYFQIVLDLSKVSFLDSSGMAALVAGLKETRQAGGTLKICGLTEQASTVLRITMLDRIFELYPDAEQAIKAL